MLRVLLIAFAAAPAVTLAAESFDTARHDVDRDGQLSVEEWRDAFVTLDVNGDGRLSSGEIAENGEPATEPVAGQPQTAAQRSGERAVGSRQVEAEASRLSATGQADPLAGEETDRGGERGGGEHLDAWDSNDDGRLSQAEWSASNIGGDFDTLDANDDDELDLRELGAAAREEDQ